MLSFGNGAPLYISNDPDEQENHYKRNNLFEITSDGNVYYNNGKKDLFTLENKISEIENNLEININNLNLTNYLNSINYDNIKSDYINENNSNFNYGNDDWENQIILPINHNSPSQLIIDEDLSISEKTIFNQNKNIHLYINDNNQNLSFKKTILINSNCFYYDGINYSGNNYFYGYPFIFFNSIQNYKIYINSINEQYQPIGIKNYGYNIKYIPQNTTNPEWSGVSPVFTIQISNANNCDDFLIKIDIEVINKMCLINYYTYPIDSYYTY